MVCFQWGLYYSKDLYQIPSQLFELNLNLSEEKSNIYNVRQHLKRAFNTGRKTYKYKLTKKKLLCRLICHRKLHHFWANEEGWESQDWYLHCLSHSVPYHDAWISYGHYAYFVRKNGLRGSRCHWLQNSILQRNKSWRLSKLLCCRSIRC